MDAFDALSNDGHEHQLPMGVDNDTYESSFTHSPPPPVSVDYGSPFDTAGNDAAGDGVDNIFTDSDQNNIFLSDEPVLPSPSVMMDEPVLPPPSEMLPEEGVAFREWRRQNAIHLEEKEKREKEMRNQIIDEAEEYIRSFYEKRGKNMETNKANNREREKLCLANQEKFHKEADKHFWKAIAELIPHEVANIEKKRGRRDPDQKPSITIIQGPKPGKPTDLTRMRQLFFKLKQKPPAHMMPPPPAPAKDGKDGKDGKDAKNGKDGKDAKEEKDGKTEKGATPTAAGNVPASPAKEAATAGDVPASPAKEADAAGNVPASPAKDAASDPPKLETPTATEGEEAAAPEAAVTE
ncbi:hypothetical protein Dsin_031454 [Dipteronia sinensis]|uniref:Clathrin light chain n=1 Tax=Dipteronia sinensis TaxID=43782 RepID=A0AAD9ZLY4_9ROSI|nr:hypothetical protein Dsin_031454 [Dipteronia sinensis]